MASVCSPDSRPVEGSLVKPGFYSVLEKLPLEYIGPSERFFLWLEFAFSVMSGTPLNSSVIEKMSVGREDYEAIQRGFLDCIRLLGDDMERKPYEDLLGDYHEMLNSRMTRTANGQFYTPMPVCRLMAKITVSEQLAEKLKLGEVIQMNEPACGSGRNMLAVAEILSEYRSKMRVTCTDIDIRACWMCFINLTMWGIPATVIHGDTLSGKEWGRWVNVFWLIGEAERKRQLKVKKIIDAVQKLCPDEQNIPAFPRRRD